MLTLTVVVAILLLLTITVMLYMQLPKFGAVPTGERLERMKRSPNYRDGAFQNITFTPTFAEGYSMPGVMYDFLFKRRPQRYPTGTIPSIKTDLHTLSLQENLIVWFGHSSYYMQVAGKRILVDPVFSGNASPLPGTTKAFKGTDIYNVDDLPPIDYLFISHDHYDHIDYETIIQLKNKTNKVVCGLGVGAHFERWGYNSNDIVEADWNETITLDKDLIVHTAPARHFSGRGFKRNNTLWLSYLLQTPTMKIYLGGDSGYDKHFAEIGNKYGPIDIALLDNGQYDPAWRYIHALPREVLQAVKDLKAKRLFPIHSAKFALGNHPWDEPLSQVSAMDKDFNIPLVTPMIGEVVRLDDEQQVFRKWWKDIA